MKKDAVDEDFSKSNIGSHLEKIGWLIIVSAAMIIAIYAFTFRELPMNEDPGRWGAFGDFVGGLLNPLISTCTFIVAVRVFQLQKIETKMARDALEGSRQAMQEQARIAEQQRSEQRFFDVLKIYNLSLDQMEHSNVLMMGEDRIISRSTGKMALSSILLDIFNNDAKLSCINYMDVYGFFGVINYLLGIRNFNEKFQSYCAVAFFLLNSSIENNKPKQPYAGLFSGQLTRNELIVIVIYSIINKNYCKETLIILDSEINLFGNMGDDAFLKVIKTYLSSDTSFQEVKNNAH